MKPKRTGNTMQTKADALLYLKVIAPEIGAKETASAFIDMAAERCGVSYFGELWNQAVANLAAHIATLSDRDGGDAGAIASRREGDLSVGYSAGSGDDDFLATLYGRAYWLLLKQCGKGVTISAGPRCGCRGIR